MASDAGSGGQQVPELPTPSLSSKSSRQSLFPTDSSAKGKGTGRIGSSHSSVGYGLDSQQTATRATEGREVTQEEASRWASQSAIPVSVEVSAFTGDGVEEVFSRLAKMILTKIEVGEIDPDDPMSGIQYGDGGWVDDGDGASVKSGTTIEEGGLGRRRRKGSRRVGTGRWGTGMREWEAVFRLDSSSRRRKGGCC